LSSEDRDIAHAGGMFSFAYEPWVDSGTLNIPRPTDIDTQSPTRYDNPHVQQIAVAAELYGSLSSNLQEALADPECTSTFKAIVSPYFI
jgi:hypothetical protein